MSFDRLEAQWESQWERMLDSDEDEYADLPTRYNVEEMEGALDRIVSALYGKKEIDLVALDEDLEEIFSQLQIRSGIPKHLPTIRRFHESIGSPNDKG